MSTKTAKTRTSPSPSSNPTVPLDAHRAALVTVAAARAALDAAKKAEANSRAESYHPAPLAAVYATACAERDLLLAQESAEAARLDALRAGAGADEETPDPRVFGAAELAAELAPVLARRLAAEKAIEAADQEAARFVAAMSERRAAVAQERAGSPLGAPGPVPTRTWEVMREKARQEASGCHDAGELCRVAGWVTAMGTGDIPDPLRHDAEGLTAACLAGVRPVPKGNVSRLRQIEAQIVRLEVEAAAKAEEDREAAEARARAARAREADREQTVARERAEQDARAAEAAKARAEQDARREAGRAALRGAA